MTEIQRITDQVKIFDTTLRDGAQSPGISLSNEECLNIAHQLNRLGVDVIEAGFPISSAGNFEAVQSIAREVEGPVIAGLARVHREDIDRAAEAVKDSQNPRIHTFVSTSDIHIEHQMRSTRNDVKGLARAAVAQAKGYVDDVEFSPMDATRADIDFTAEVCAIAIEEGATTINIPDTVGYTTPDEYYRYLNRLYELVPALGTVTLSVHCHNDLGLAVANSFAGIQAGARQVECAVNGLGERAGNAALEEIVMLLSVRGTEYRVHTQADTRQIGPTSRMISRYTGYDVQRNKAIVGDNAFRHESGIHQDGVIKEKGTFEIMSAEAVGIDTESIVLGKQSGRAAVEKILNEEGVYNPGYLKQTFLLFKELADKVGDISREQIVEIHEEAQRREKSPYKLVDSTVTGGRGKYAAEVELWLKGSRRKATASNDLYHPDVDGPTSALYTAINEATETNYELKSYQVESIGTGKQTIGKTTVVLGINGKSVTGHGVSLDTSRADAWAYLDAISKADKVKIEDLA